MVLISKKVNSGYGFVFPTFSLQPNRTLLSFSSFAVSFCLVWFLFLIGKYVGGKTWGMGTIERTTEG